MNRRELIGGLGAALALGLPQRVWAEPAPKPKPQLQSGWGPSHTILLMDGIPDSQGEIVDGADIFLKDDGLVPVYYDFRENMQMGWARLHKNHNSTQVYGYFKFIPSESFQVVVGQLYPAVGGHVSVREANMLRKVTVDRIGLSMSPNCDRRILRLNGLP